MDAGSAAGRGNVGAGFTEIKYRCIFRNINLFQYGAVVLGTEKALGLYFYREIGIKTIAVFKRKVPAGEPIGRKKDIMLRRIRLNR